MSKTFNYTEEIISVSKGKEDIGKLALLANDGKFDPSVIPMIDDLQEQITREETARSEADKQLQDNIGVEVTARTNADAKLQGNIDIEANTRAVEDKNLQDKIATEIVDRTNTDNQLQTSIDSEVVTRIDADEAESHTRARVDKNLQEEIDILKGKNAFSNVVIDGTTIQADSQTDTIELAAGTNIALTADATNEKVTIAVSGKVASAAQADYATIANSATSAASCTGNAATAKKLETAIKINGVAFDGSADITITTGIVPIGSIVMWSGSIASIPSQWALCNGSNSTPDLRDKFVLGAGNSYSVGATGGEATHMLTVAEMPAHTHTTTFIRDQCSGISGNAVYGDENRDGTNDVTSQSTGGGGTHNNMPPYYALAYIMRIA